MTACIGQPSRTGSRRVPKMGVGRASVHVREPGLVRFRGFHAASCRRLRASRFALARCRDAVDRRPGAHGLISDGFVRSSARAAGIAVLAIQAVATHKTHIQGRQTMRHFIFIGMLLWACARARWRHRVTYGGPVGGTDIRAPTCRRIRACTVRSSPSARWGKVLRQRRAQPDLGQAAGRNRGIRPALRLSGAAVWRHAGQFRGHRLRLGSIKVNGKHQSFKGMNDIYTDVLMWSRHLGEVEGGRRAA